MKESECPERLSGIAAIGFGVVMLLFFLMSMILIADYGYRVGIEDGAKVECKHD